MGKIVPSPKTNTAGGLGLEGEYSEGAEDEQEQTQPVQSQTLFWFYGTVKTPKHLYLRPYL